MALDTEDRVLHDDTPASRPEGRDTDALAMAARNALAAAFEPRPAPRVAVVVKKRRLFSMDEPAQDGAAAACAVAVDETLHGERGPRVFVMPKDPSLAPAGDAAATATADVHSAIPRRRRRASAGHRPSPVVHIVRPAPEPSPVSSIDDDTDAPFTLSLPEQDEYKAAQAALARLRRLVQEASQAQAFQLKPRGR